MSEYLIQGSTLTSIADAIRTKTGNNKTFTPAQMVSAIMSISGGGSSSSFCDAFLINISDYEVPSIFYNDTSSIINVNITPPRTIIDSDRFNGNSSLLSVSMPSVSIIQESVFAYCTNLSSVSFPICTSIAESAFYSCESLSEIIFPSCTYIGSSAFANCSKLTNISFPVCTSIGESAFCYCSVLSNISFPVCTSIGESAFYSCSALSNISFPSVEYIGSNAFGPYGYDASVNFYFLGNSSSVISVDGYWLDTNDGGHGIYVDYSLSIYVPASMYNDYLAAEYWSDYSSWIVSVST